MKIILILFGFILFSGAGQVNAIVNGAGSELACFSLLNLVTVKSVNLETDELDLKSLSVADVKDMSNLFDVANGRYKLKVLEMICKGSQVDNSREAHRVFTAEVVIKSISQKTLMIDAVELKDEKNDSRILQKALWWQWGAGRLNAGEGSVEDILHQRWNVEVVDVASNRLVYLTRQRQLTGLGGFLRKIIVTRLSKNAARGDDSELEMQRYYYTQGELTAKEHWIFKK